MIAFFEHSKRIVTLCMIALVIAAVMMLTGIFIIGRQTWQLEAQQKSILSYEDISKKRWDQLAEHNPQIAVPEVIEDAKAPPVIVVQEKPEPSPTPAHETAQAPTPTSRVKVKTITRYRIHRTPTPSPWYKFFQNTR